MENEKRTLADLLEGERASVYALHVDDALHRRLSDMGLIAGTQVECLQKSACGGLAAYRIRGAVIALRHGDAMRIAVS